MLVDDGHWVAGRAHLAGARRVGGVEHRASHPVVQRLVGCQVLGRGVSHLVDNGTERIVLQQLEADVDSLSQALNVARLFEVAVVERGLDVGVVFREPDLALAVGQFEDALDSNAARLEGVGAADGSGER